VFPFGLQILQMSLSSESILDHIADYLKFISGTQSFWYMLNTSYNHDCHLASWFHWEQNSYEVLLVVAGLAVAVAVAVVVVVMVKMVVAVAGGNGGGRSCCRGSVGGGGSDCRDGGSSGEGRFGGTVVGKGSGSGGGGGVGVGSGCGGGGGGGGGGGEDEGSVDGKGKGEGSSGKWQ
jgi:hypothetical protein